MLIGVFVGFMVQEIHCGVPPPYTENYVQQFVDHFNYQNQDVFGERYLLVGELLSARGDRVTLVGSVLKTSACSLW